MPKNDHILIMTHMNATFGMFTEFIFEHMIFYMNLLTTISKGKKQNSKKKRIKKIKKV